MTTRRGRASGPAEPPRAAVRLLAVRLPADDRDVVLGDLTETFADRIDAGCRLNRLWFWMQTLAFVGGFAIARRREVPRMPPSGRHPMRALAVSLRHAARRLRFEWRYALGVTAILAVGIGPATTMLSIVRTVLLDPLPYAEPERLGLFRLDLGQIRNHPGLSPAEITDLQGLTGVFTAVEGTSRIGEVSMGPAEDLVPLTQVGVTPGLFRMLGVAPVLGRWPTAEDARLQPPPAWIDYDLWQTAFGGSEDLVGQTVRLDGRPVPIAGVMPRGFRLVLGRGAPVPIDVYVAMPPRTNRNFWAFPTLARLAPGVTFAQAQAAVDAYATSARAAHPDVYTEDDLRFALHPLRDDLLRETRPAIRAALGGVLLLLLIAFANAAALVVARLGARAHDLAIRRAIGAGRARLVADVLVESGILAAAGAVGGAVLGAAGLVAARRVMPETVPRLESLHVSVDLWWWSAALAGVGLVIAGLVPVWRVSRGAPWRGLGTGSVRSGRAEGALSRLVLVGAQVALTVVLAFGAVQLVRSASRLSAVDVGFDRQVLTFKVPIDFARYQQAPDQVALYERVRDRLRQVAGIEAVGAVSHLPLSGATLTDIYTPDLAAAPGGNLPVANYHAVLPGYFASMDIPFVAGRDFTDAENRAGEPVIVVDETLARSAFPGGDAVGRTLRLGWGIPDSRIVGVVRHVRAIEVGREVRPQIYAAYGTFQWPPLLFTVRTSRAPRDLEPAIAAAVADERTGRAVSSFRVLDENVQRATSTLRAVTGLVGTLALSAGLLSAVGLYTVIAFVVHQRRRATAIRSALGASRGQLVRHHLRTIGLVLLAALPVGLALAWGVAPLFESLVFGIGDRDPASLGLALALATLAAAAGIVIPIQRAAGIDPVVVLRAEE
ncbi:MAG: ABC transporter permease [Vicinamibacterales bacterium]